MRSARAGLLPEKNIIETLVNPIKPDQLYDEHCNLLQKLRREFDEIHSKCMEREGQIERIKERARFDETMSPPLVEPTVDFEDQLKEADHQHRILNHMLMRSQKEFEGFRQEFIKAEEEYTKVEAHKKKEEALNSRLTSDLRKTEMELEALRLEAEGEQRDRQFAQEEIDQSVASQRKDLSNKQDFEVWRQEVAVDTACEASHTTVDKLHKQWGLECLLGHCLDGVIRDQIDATEKMAASFARIQEVTGLPDITQITDRFLNRESEYLSMLKATAESEETLQRVTEEYKALKEEYLDTQAGGPVEDSHDEALWEASDPSEASFESHPEDDPHDPSPASLTYYKIGLYSNWVSSLCRKLGIPRETPQSLPELVAFVEKLPTLLKDISGRSSEVSVHSHRRPASKQPERQWTANQSMCPRRISKESSSSEEDLKAVRELHKSAHRFGAR